MIQYRRAACLGLRHWGVEAIVLAGLLSGALFCTGLRRDPGAFAQPRGAGLLGWAWWLSAGLTGVAVVGGVVVLARKLRDRNAAQGGLIRQSAEWRARAQAAETRIRELTLQLVAVQEAERRHIGQELHDEIGQLLSVLKLTLPPAQHEGSAAAAVLDDLIRRVRQMSLDLRPAMLDDLGLVPAVLWLTERFEAPGGPEIRLEHAGVERRFPQAVETAAFRLVQEALTNAVRHSRSPRVIVRLWADADGLGVQVEDRGVGFNPAAALRRGRSSGLSGMRDRVRSLGGDFTIDSDSGVGTRVMGELPITPLKQGVER